MLSVYEMLFTVTNENAGRVDEIVDYMRGPRLWIPQLDYPDYDLWIQRVHSQLSHDKKRAMVALDRGNVMGAVVYQHHASLPGTLEIKNITVRPDVRGRHIAGFLLRNAEIEGRIDFNTSRIVVDTKKSNLEMRAFLLSQRYRPICEVDLYSLSAGDDIVFEKTA